MSKRVAFLFPGQGSQAVGMGKDFYASFDASRQLLDQVSALVAPDAEGRTLKEIMFEGPASSLNRTVYTQPALLGVSLACYQAFMAQVDVQPVAVAGHSLGEFAALVAANVLPLDAVVPVVEKRASLMEQAPAGAMTAVLGLDAEAVQAVLVQAKTSTAWAVVANDNTPGQIVISGTPEGIEAATPLLKEASAKRVIPLPVGGAFHSPLMQEAAGTFSDVLRTLNYQDARVPLVSNMDATPRQDGKAIADALSQQMTSSVQWTRTMDALVNDLAIDAMIEFGPGKVLAGMMKKTHPSVEIYNIYDIPSLEATIAAFNDVPVESVQGV
jgi:[acyl-carrier-protein] S-malonyltransferase